MKGKGATTLFHWSGGKDSMLALHYLSKMQDFNVVRLLTNFSTITERVSMHGVRSILLEKQAESLGLPLDKMFYAADEYDIRLAEKFKEAFNEGITTVAYGDIFLEDLKEYRDRQLSENQLHGVYPLWKEDSNKLIQEFIDLGYQSVIVCVNGSSLDKSFVGRVIDEDFLNDLPTNVDPCGENGEFHSFVFDGPLFQFPIPYIQGEIIEKRYPNPSEDSDDIRFWFGDLLLK